MTTLDCKNFCPLRNGSCQRDCKLKMDDGGCAIVQIAESQAVIANALDANLPDITKELYGIKMDLPRK